MDILTHTLSGVAVATVVASSSKIDISKKINYLILGAFAGALPDFDAISLWSKFDKYFGKILNLKHTGNTIYFSKFWYSHHGFLHSIFASILLITIFLLMFYLFQNQFKLKDYFYVNKLYFLTFILAFNLHLLEDMPTPACVWGGVNYFWPSKTYIGGSGDIWWWNNYDIFLIVVFVIITNCVLHMVHYYFQFRLIKLTLTVFIIGFCLSLYQIKTRGYDFNYYGHDVDFRKNELKSKEIQKKILGNKIYSFMVKFDKRVKLNF